MPFRSDLVDHLRATRKRPRFHRCAGAGPASWSRPGPGDRSDHPSHLPRPRRDPRCAHPVSPWRPSCSRSSFSCSVLAAALSSPRRAAAEQRPDRGPCGGGLHQRPRYRPRARLRPEAQRSGQGRHCRLRALRAVRLLAPRLKEAAGGHAKTVELNLENTPKTIDSEVTRLGQMFHPAPNQ
jgi:hypothetical protein